MSSTDYEAPRAIADAFFTGLSDFDGVDGGVPYIDCSQKTSNASGPKGICKGIHIGSITDSETLAEVKLRFKGSNEIVTFKLTTGVTHNYKLDRIYGNYGNAADVRILF
jgi:hypothetical protein